MIKNALKSLITNKQQWFVKRLSQFVLLARLKEFIDAE